MSDDDEVTRLRAQLAVSQAATEAAISEATRQALSSAEVDALIDENDKLRESLADCAVAFGEILKAIENDMSGDAKECCRLTRALVLDVLER